MVSHLSCARFIHPTVNHTCLPKALRLVAYFSLPVTVWLLQVKTRYFTVKTRIFYGQFFFDRMAAKHSVYMPALPTHLNKSIGCRALGARRLTDAVASGIGR